jgi:hypothetical protein
MGIVNLNHADGPGATEPFILYTASAIVNGGVGGLSVEQGTHTNKSMLASELELERRAAGERKLRTGHSRNGCEGSGRQCLMQIRRSGLHKKRGYEPVNDARPGLSSTMSQHCSGSLLYVETPFRSLTENFELPNSPNATQPFGDSEVVSLVSLRCLISFARYSFIGSQAPRPLFALPDRSYSSQKASTARARHNVRSTVCAERVFAP